MIRKVLPFFLSLPAAAINVPSPCTSGGGCPGDEPECSSLSWKVDVGLARYNKPATLTDFGRAAFERNGDLPDFQELNSRYFPTSPFQRSEIKLYLSQTQLSPATFSPDVLFLQAEANFETLKKPGANGSSEYIHQILTDDCFTLIDYLPAPDSGWRLRVWKRNAAALNKVGGYYVTTTFETKTPLKDVVFKRPTGVTTSNALIYIQKDTTGIAGTRIITNEVVQTLDSIGRTLNVTTKVFSGEGTGGPVLSKQELVYSERGNQTVGASQLGSPPKLWDYSIMRKVYTASLDASGTPGPLTLTRSTLEDYDDFSIEVAQREAEITDATPNWALLVAFNKVVRETLRNYLPYNVMQPHSIGGLPGMKRLVSLTEAYNVPGQTPQTTRYNYYYELLNFDRDPLDYLRDAIGNPTDLDAAPPEPKYSLVHGRLKDSVRPDGSWEFNEYVISPSNPVSVITKYSSWNDLTMAQRSSARKEVTTVSANGSSIQTFVAGQLISHSRSSLTATASETITTAEDWDGSAWHVSRTGYHPDSSPSPLTGRIKWIENADGTAATYSYAVAGANLVMTTRTGAGSRAGVTSGTEIVGTHDIGNLLVAQITKDIASNLVTEGWDTDLTYNGGFDATGRPIKRIYNADVNDFDIRQYACCGLEEARERDGSSSKYFRDGLKRLYKVETKASAASPAVAEMTTIDGLTTTRTRVIGGQSLFLGSSTRSIDRLTRSTTDPSRKSNLPADRPVTTVVTTRSATGDTETTTNADLSTSIVANYLDGRVKSVSGTAVPDKTYGYSGFVVLGGGVIAPGLTETHTASGVTTDTHHDLLGRISRVILRGTGITPTSTTASDYFPLTAAPGSRGKLRSVTDGDGVALTYGYNPEGERTTTSRTVPIAGGTATQVTTTDRDVLANVTLHGTALGTCQREIQKVSSAGIPAVTLSETYVPQNRLASGSISLGRQTLVLTTRPDASGQATRTTTHPDGTKTVETRSHGLTTAVQKKSTSGSVITGTSYGYDMLQRLGSVTDLRTGTTTYDADANGQLDLTESGQALAVKTPANHTTLTAYDIMGREISTTLPDTTVKRTAYHPTGLVKVTWGSQTYPTWHIYDEQGRMTQLHTWKSAPTLDPANIPVNPPAGSEVTTWTYSPATGLLARKQYADTKGTDYTYTAAGRLQTRLWARGITTTYGYTHGYPTSTDYSDTTPDVTTRYDALGRVATVTQTNQSQLAYTYDPANLALDTETIRYDLDHNGIYEFTRVLDRSDDALGRSEGWAIWNGGVAPEHSNTYTYHSATGRLHTVDALGFPKIPGESHSFEYAYLTNSNSLVETLAGPTLEQSNYYYSNRDVLSERYTETVTATPSYFDYYVNAIGQRTLDLRIDDLFAPASAYAYTSYKYDEKGQVKTANSTTNTKDFGYAYDGIGNRTASSRNTTDTTTATGADLAVYRSGTDSASAPGGNALNQYSRLELYGQTAVDNTHDFDGNQILGRLPNNAPGTRVWDAENRLVSVMVGSVTWHYHYDAFGRQIAKRNSSGTSASLYLYDGWNRAAEYLGTYGSAGSWGAATLYVWGSDLSGTLQGAGGVGGLLAVELRSTPSAPGLQGHYYPCYDGNGNITEYVDSAGQVVARFGYGPFGELVHTPTTHSPFLDYRFSTKPLDSETGLYYYGYRYYDPTTGRWPSRDPIGEQGGVNLYAFVGNDGVNSWDLWGLLELDSSGLKKANEIETRWSQNGSLPFANDGAGAAGHHIYHAEVKIECGGKSSIKGDGMIHLNQSVTPIDPTTKKVQPWPQVQGHEQRHIKSILKEIQKIVDEIKALSEPADPEKAAELTTTYQEKIEQAILDGKGHDEKGDPNSAKPMDSKGYPPLPDSPRIPPMPNNHP